MLTTVNTYLASGEMAVSVAFPDVVTCVIVNLWKLEGRTRCTSEYTPNPAATNTSRAAAAIPVALTL